MIIIFLISIIRAQIVCREKQYQLDDICYDCPFECASCTSLTQCTVCEDYYYLTEGTCLSCHPSCLQCSGNQYDQCLGCASNKRYVNGTCADRNSILLIDNQIQIKYTLLNQQLQLEIEAQNSLLSQFNTTSTVSSITIKQVPYLTIGFSNGDNTHDLNLVVVLFDEQDTNILDANMNSNSMIITQNQKQEITVSSISVNVDSIVLSFQLSQSFDGTQNVKVYYGMGQSEKLIKDSQLDFVLSYHQYSGQMIFDFLNNEQYLQTCENCLQCDTTNGVCSQCNSGYYIQNGKCSQCQMQCQTCSDSITCDTCQSTYVNTYLINGKCYNEQSILLEIGNSSLIEDGIIQYSNLVIAYYGLKVGPSIGCPNEHCLTGVCQNSFCFCQSDALGYYCEQPQESKTIVNQYISIINDQLSNVTDLLLRSAILKELSYLAYSFESGYINKLISYIEYNNTFNQSENNTLYTNYAIMILNCLEYYYFNSLEDYDQLNIYLKSFKDDAIQYNISINAIVNFGSLLVNKNQTNNDLINNNLKFATAYLQLLITSLDITNYNQYVKNPVSFILQLESTTQSNTTLYLQQSRISSLNLTQLYCFGIDAADQLQIYDQPTVLDKYYSCQMPLNSTKYLVAHYLKHLIPNQVESTLWSANNRGFILCACIQGVFLLFILFFYYQSKVDAKLLQEESVYQSVHHDQYPNSPSHQGILSPQQSGITQKAPFLNDTNKMMDVTNKMDETKMNEVPQEFQAGQDNPSDESRGECASNDLQDRPQVSQLQNMRVNMNQSDDEQGQNSQQEEQANSTIIPRPKTDDPKILVNNNIIFQQQFEQVNNSPSPAEEPQKPQADEEASRSSSDSEDTVEKEIHELYNERLAYDIWNHHPVIALYRAIKYHRDFIWQCFFLSIISGTIHMQMIFLICIYEINIAINGYQEDVQLFMVFCLVSTVATWHAMYLYGLIGTLFKKIGEEEKQDETQLSLHPLYWFMHGFFVLAVDFVVSWRVYQYELGTPDYWLASTLFSALLDFFVFDSFFLFILHILGNRLNRDRVWKFLSIKGYLHFDIYQQYQQK